MDNMRNVQVGNMYRGSGRLKEEDMSRGGVRTQD